jgi:hypothetical protein
MQELAFDLLKARVEPYRDSPNPPAEIKVSLGALRRLIDDLERLTRDAAQQRELGH